MSGSVVEELLSIAGCVQPAAVQWSLCVANEHVGPAGPRHVQ